MLVALLGLANPIMAMASKPTTGNLDREAIAKLVYDQLRSWETEDEALFLSTVHDDIVFAYPGQRLDKAGALDIFRFWAENFSDTRVRIHRLIIEPPYASVEYQFATTRDRDGVRTATGTVTVGEIVDGKIKVWKEYLDGRVSRMQAKGELPVDEGAEPFPWPEVSTTESEADPDADAAPESAGDAEGNQ